MTVTYQIFSSNGYGFLFLCVFCSPDSRTKRGPGGNSTKIKNSKFRREFKNGIKFLKRALLSRNIFWSGLFKSPFYENFVVFSRTTGEFRDIFAQPIDEFRFIFLRPIDEFPYIFLRSIDEFRDFFHTSADTASFRICTRDLYAKLAKVFFSCNRWTNFSQDRLTNFAIFYILIHNFFFLCKPISRRFRYMRIENYKSSR